MWYPLHTTCQNTLKHVALHLRYADHFEVDVTIANGGIGAYKFHVLSLRRSTLHGCPAYHMFVSDKKGRILHVTRGLASMLGSSPKELLSGGCQHAMESLLPQPFANLHRKQSVSCDGDCGISIC